MKHHFLFLAMLACVVHGAALETRLCPQGETLVRCTVTNDSLQNLRPSGTWMTPGNTLYSCPLSNARRSWINMSISVGEHAYGIDIPPNGVVTNVLDISDGWLYFHGCGYALIRWHLNEHRSNVASLTIGLRDWEERPCPAKASCDASLALFLHRHEEQLDNTDIGFLVLNGSNAAVTVAQPLFNDSRLIVHAPKIGYSNEVFAVDATATNATVAARGTTEWRVSWTNLWNRIPAADRTSLTNAHEVDLYWRTGEFTSEALPLWIE